MARAISKKNWTVMVYLAGDNNLDGAGVVDLKEMKKVGSTPEINILAQFDRQGAGSRTKRYFLKKGGTFDQDAVADLGETNTGDPKVLEDFIKWGAVSYPAEHFLVVVWNHGAGWDDTNVYRAANRLLKLDVIRKNGIAARSRGGALGTVSSRQIRSITDRRFRRALFSSTVTRAIRTRAIAFDDNAKDFLDNIEMKRLLGSAKKALKCLMSMVEVGYQVRDSVTYTVGSEQVEPGDGWPYDTILAELAKKPTMTPDALSKVIVKKYLAAYSTAEPVTQSAFDLTRSDTMTTAIDQLAKAMTSNLSNATVRAAALSARNQVQTYEVPDYIDLVDFATLLKAQVTLAALQSACQDVIDAAKIGQFVVASGYKGQPMAGSHGVSIYFPTKQISPLYAKLDFTQNTAWDEFLRAYITATTRRPV
jgi:hypothetical protein